MLNLDGGYNGGGQTATENDKLADAYKVLGVDPSATNDEVKAAYRKMALKHHPTVWPRWERMCASRPSASFKRSMTPRSESMLRVA